MSEAPLDFDAWYADRLKPADREECLEAFRAGAHSVRAAQEAAEADDDESDDFECPKCGGSYFGTSINADQTLHRGHCHDQFSTGCRFSWDRKTQDAEVGLVRSSRFTAARETETAPDAWQSEYETPAEHGWYRIKRADGTRCVRSFGGGGLWWIPLPRGWLSGLPAGFSWRGPAIPMGLDKERSPLEECNEVEAQFALLEP